ncbi:MAG: choice-of-anchor D domain-containing protein [Blastocatellia bacterium]
MKAITHSVKFWCGLLLCLGLLISADAIVKKSQAAAQDGNQPKIQTASPDGSEELLADDGTIETFISGNGVIAVNRLTPSAYPATLQSIRLIFPQVTGLPNPVGSQITLIAFTGASGTTQPVTNPTLLVNQTVTIPIAMSSNGFVDFTIQNGPTITGGDFYVGFKTPNPFAGVTYATDTDSAPRQRAFVSTDNGANFSGPLTFPGTTTPLNLLIRAVVMNDAQPVPRIGVPTSLNFGSSAVGVTQPQTLTISNTGSAPLNITSITSSNAQFTLLPVTFPLTIAPGAQTQITVRFTPASAGAQTGTLTIASNDPATPSATVALSGVGGSATSAATVFVNSGASVTGSIVAPSAGSGVLLSTQYAIFVPPGATQLKIDLTGNQDVDLFARFNQRIIISGGNLITDYSSIQDGIVPESLTITPTSTPALQSGLYYIGVANFGPGAANFTLTATITGGTAPAVVTTVSAASFLGTNTGAAEQIVAFFGSNLATGTQVASTIPLPTTLLGTTVKVRDNAGTERLAPLFFVSSGQINALIPIGTVNDAGQITITSGDGKIAVGTIQIASVSPGLFTANANGVGVPAATVFRLKAGGAQSFEALSRVDGQNGSVPIPIDLGVATDQVFLILNGTGIRGRTSLSAVTATIGGTSAPVSFAGVQGDFVGLDQINVGIPRSLIGRGDVDVVLTVDGKITNTVKVNIK